ncbi:TPA: uracil-DNA glycosylase [bacterium]|nr:uracil-DNA glycosylase [bacterium]
MRVNNGWKEFFKEETKKEYFLNLESFLSKEYQNNKVYPSRENLFNCFRLTSLEDVKVVILGQDPYHQPSQAHGLAFSVQRGVKIPPSLRNIFKEINNDTGAAIPSHGDLTYLAKQGVLLLNTILTVEDSKPLSHQNKGWEIFTDRVIDQVNNSKQPIVFLLWGNNSRNKKELITNKEHLVLEAPHPSPLSSYHGFFGCKHFSKANEFLIKNNLKPIDWEIKE